MKFWVYLLASSVLFGAMILESMILYPNYFSSLVGIPDSAVKACIVINFAGCLAILWFQFVVFLFLDSLSFHEYQSVYQRAWIFFCNTLLYWGTASINSQVNPYNLGVGGLSALTLLVLHWICRSRVRALQAFDTSSLDPRSIFKTFRLAILCTILGFIDVGMCQISWEKFGTRDFSLFFSIFIIDISEMCIVLCGELVVNTLAIYHLYRNEDEDEWERSALLTKSAHLVSSLMGIAAHGTIIMKYGIWRSDIGSIVMRTIRLYRNVTGLWKVITAKSEVDKFTSPATDEELQRDNTCVICRDEMYSEDASHKRKAAKKLGCGHVMHSGCLGSWLTRSQNCPTCRQPVQSAASSFRNDEGQHEGSNNPTSPLHPDNANLREVDSGSGSRHDILQNQNANDRNILLEPHVSVEIENVLNRARERIRSQNESRDARVSGNPRQTSSETIPDEKAKYLAPLGVHMTGSNAGILGERYKFTLRNGE